VVEQVSAPGPSAGHLPRQLAADGAAGAGDEHAAALHQPRHALAVERDLRAVQQLLDSHLAELEPRRFGLLHKVRAALRRRVERGDGGRAAHRHAVAVGGVHQALQRQALHVPGGEHDQRRQAPLVAHPLQHRPDLVHRAEDGVAADAPSRLAGAHGEDAEHAVARRTLAGQRPDEQVRAVARAHQQHGLRRHAVVRPAAGVVDARGHPRQGQQHGERQRVDDGEGRVGRALDAQRHQPAPEQRRPAGRGDGDTEEVRQPGVAPILLRQPHRQSGQQQHGRGAGQGAEPPHLVRPRRGYEQHRQRDRQRGQHRVEREVQQDAVGSPAAGHGGALGQPGRGGQCGRGHHS
jgi:hypothetical protein